MGSEDVEPQGARQVDDDGAGHGLDRTGHRGHGGIGRGQHQHVDTGGGVGEVVAAPEERRARRSRHRRAPMPGSDRPGQGRSGEQ